MERTGMDVHEFRLGELRPRLIAEGDRVVVHARSAAGFEPATLAAWAGLCERGRTVIDVGAYTGIYSIVAALAGCRVLAFEPMPFNSARLRANVRLNNVAVELSEAAATDRAGTADLVYNAKAALTSGASLVGKRPLGWFLRRKWQMQRVSTLTIDSFELTELKAMKIDVERGEPLVLAGARKTLERLRPAIIAEALDGEQQAAVLREASGYRIAERLDKRNLLLLPA